MFVSAVECKECETTVYSRAHDDVRSCNCGRVTVMGGQTYFKYDVCTNPDYEVKKISVDATAEELYYDWEFMEDRFGSLRTVPPAQEQKIYSI